MTVLTLTCTLLETNEPVVSLNVSLETGTVKPPASATGTRTMARMITAMIARGRILFDFGFDDGVDVISYAALSWLPNGIIDLFLGLSHSLEVPLVNLHDGVKGFRGVSDCG